MLILMSLLVFVSEHTHTHMYFLIQNICSMCFGYLKYNFTVTLYFHCYNSMRFNTLQLELHMQPLRFYQQMETVSHCGRYSTSFGTYLLCIVCFTQPQHRQLFLFIYGRLYILSVYEFVSLISKGNHHHSATGLVMLEFCI